jgi:GNAT superfamily N-acetyltransferase
MAQLHPVIAQTTHHTRVLKASAGDGPRIGETLGRAFFDDPILRWACPDDERRRALLPRFFELYAETMWRLGEIYVAGPGAALWAPPGSPAVPDEYADEFGRRVVEMTPPEDAERLFAVSKVIDEHHPPGSYWFLQFMGVEPASQGRGIGSALVASVLERCDRDGAYAYLDATSPDNKRLYERHGFRAAGVYAPAGGPPLWPMWREPGARAAG